MTIQKKHGGGQQVAVLIFKNFRAVEIRVSEDFAKDRLRCDSHFDSDQP